jgi:hypothetical protein
VPVFITILLTQLIPALGKLALEHIDLVVAAVLAPLMIWIYRHVSRGTAAQQNARLVTMGEIARGLAAAADAVTDLTPTKADDKIGPALRALSIKLMEAGHPPLTPAEVSAAHAAVIAVGLATGPTAAQLQAAADAVSAPRS